MNHNVENPFTHNPEKEIRRRMKYAKPISREELYRRIREEARKKHADK